MGLEETDGALIMGLVTKLNLKLSLAPLRSNTVAQYSLEYATNESQISYRNNKYIRVY